MSQRFDALHSDDDDSLLPVYIGLKHGPGGEAGGGVGDDDQSMREVVKSGMVCVLVSEPVDAPVSPDDKAPTLILTVPPCKVIRGLTLVVSVVMWL